MVTHAYAFLECPADLDAVTKEVEALQKEAPAGTLDQLVLAVGDVSEPETTNAMVEPASDEWFQLAYDAGLRYAIKATAQERPGEKIAEDLVWLANALYRTSLYGGEDIRREIVYEDTGGVFQRYLD